MFQKLASRWNATTPALFKNIQKVGIMLATVSTAISTSTLPLPSWLTSYAPHLAAISVIISIICQFMVIPSDSDSKA